MSDSFFPALEQEWRWPGRYATPPRILEYPEHVADRFDLRRDVHLSTRVRSARHDGTRTILRFLRGRTRLSR